MDRVTRNDLKQSLFHARGWIRAAGTAALLTGLAWNASPVATATPVDIRAGGESGAVTGAGFGPTLGVGDALSYTGGSTSNSVCLRSCAAATLGVGGPSSYTGGATVNNPGGTATLGVGDVNSYTGGGTPGTANNGTNATTRTQNYGPGHP